ncbi:MMPL family transporter [Actinocrispum wychmicini]|uniref:RND superfamily putative drug exporter n=1 Tax=Actinocrispum wychmicini TaxID=1213861 RepID=A0A4R2JF94_9PSEU|nr:MMPL family transporter [Actinocrispum wychmicini]TCO52905.1 RND superfamily putative drug exporter [Actinocrispum wychmicini]
MTLHRLGTVCARHPWRVVAAWVVAIAAVTALANVIGGGFRDAMTAPGTSSDRAAQQLRASFPDATGAEAHIVATPVDQDTVTRTANSLRALPGVRSVTVQRNDRIVLLTVQYAAELPDLDAQATVDQLDTVAQSLAGPGVRVAVGGEIPQSVQGPNGVAEAVGAVVALLVLLLAFGSALAAGLPLMVAVAGLGVGLGLIGLLAAVVDVNSVSPTLGSMLGLGVGIDYGLFVVARHRQGMAARLSPVEAAAHATATAGKSVVFAGLSVLIGITGLVFSGMPGFATMGLAAALVIFACVGAAITLLPALLGALGPRVFSRKARKAATLPSDSFHSGWAERLARRVTHRPVLWLVISATALLALALPALGMRLGENDPGSESADKPTRQAYDLVAEGFGAGANGPLTVVAGRDQARSLHDSFATVPGVRSVTPTVDSPDPHTSVFQVIPTTGPQTAATRDLLATLNRRLPPGADITGPTAAMVDMTATLTARLWIVIAAVLAATFALLLVVFRSLVLPAKAVLANLMSVAASYGVLTLAFQTKVGAALIGLAGPVPIAGWVPMVLFAILFGLSMDYEVFMLSTVKENHDQGMSDRDSVVHGLGASAKIIGYAAAIMISVAAGFAFDTSVMVKIIGVGMAVAILVDVTLVRLLLVPAAMAVLGKANWYLPFRKPGSRPRTGPGHPAEASRNPETATTPGAG